MARHLKTPESSCRPRAESELSALVDLWVASWQKAMPQIDFEARRDWFRDHLSGLEAGGFQTICAFDMQGIIVGFVTVNPKTHNLAQLAVTPDAWGSGLASQLLAEARRLSPEALVLDVNEDNPRAIRFYQREGFVRTGEGVNALSGLKTLRMQWRLGPTT
ncbi:GNAT family N-acetyltransferase [Methyloferula stellata]|uniref:GNAT family N-acetyltransferase n=1 Tax=Methyloferula stellata TaxID=876270 RepID=UPI0009FE9A08|nr:GNAT family N-acetyltransferase [Methyloferula stellata]